MIFEAKLQNRFTWLQEMEFVQVRSTVCWHYRFFVTVQKMGMICSRHPCSGVCHQQIVSLRNPRVLV